MGATCLDGKWSPNVIPTCIQENHPAIKWLDKRSVRKQDMEEVFPARRKRSISEEVTMSCPELDLKLMTTQVLKKSEKNAGLYNSAGTTVKVTCMKGYRPNTPRNKVRCRKGEWKPSQPHCLAKSCKVPPVQGGTYSYNKVPAPVRTHISHSQSIYLACHSGYRLQGPNMLPCSYGDWVSEHPRCVGVPCKLPSIPTGQYIGDNHRSDQIVPHDTLVDYQCQPGFLKSSRRPLQCKTGSLVPTIPQCNEDLAGPKAEPFLNSEQNEEPHSGVDVDVDSVLPNTFSNSFPDTAVQSCSPPEELDNALVFLSKENVEEDIYLSEALLIEGDIDYSNSSDILDMEEDVDDAYEDMEENIDSPPKDFYPNGTVIKFKCTQTRPGQFSSWQISCSHGTWLGQSVECDSAGNTLDEVTASGFNMSCKYKPAGNKLVAFYQDLQVTKELSIPAGGELVLRCSDIGKYRMEGEAGVIHGCMRDSRWLI